MTENKVVQGNFRGKEPKWPKNTILLEVPNDSSFQRIRTQLQELYPEEKFYMEFQELSSPQTTISIKVLWGAFEHKYSTNQTKYGLLNTDLTSEQFRGLLREVPQIKDFYFNPTLDLRSAVDVERDGKKVEGFYHLHSFGQFAHMFGTYGRNNTSFTDSIKPYHLHWLKQHFSESRNIYKYELAGKIVYPMQIDILSLEKRIKK